MRKGDSGDTGRFYFFIVSMGLEGYCARAAIHPLVSLSLLILGFHLRTALAHILRASAEQYLPRARFVVLLNWLLAQVFHYIFKEIFDGYL